MASKEAFLPVPTEEPVAVSVPTVPMYNTESRGASTNVSTNGNTFASSLSVENGGSGDGEFFPNSANHHVLCFNYCCDFRRAVIIVNAISIILKLLVMMGVAIFASYIGKNLDVIEDSMDDDENRDQLDEIAKSGGIAMIEATVEVIETISIALHLCGIYGALQFKRWGVITAGVTYALQFAVGVVSMDFGNMIVSALFLYPHVFMFKLMRDGVMTEYNYHNIASCCGDRRM